MIGFQRSRQGSSCVNACVSNDDMIEDYLHTEFQMLMFCGVLYAVLAVKKAFYLQALRMELKLGIEGQQHPNRLVNTLVTAEVSWLKCEHDKQALEAAQQLLLFLVKLNRGPFLQQRPAFELYKTVLEGLIRSNCNSSMAHPNCLHLANYLTQVL